jgi:magnesium chelatase family protein
MAKISGPLLDRIDIHIEVPAVPFRDLASETSGTSSQEMRAQVTAARHRQQRRFEGSRTRYNAQMTSKQLRQHAPLSDECRNLLQSAVNETGLSARAHDKILRVARTIADLDDSDRVEVPHLNEAINYRMLDRQLWV